MFLSKYFDKRLKIYQDMMATLLSCHEVHDIVYYGTTNGGIVMSEVGEIEPDTETEQVEQTKGWDFFSDQTTPGERRRYIAHGLVYAVGLVLVVWPVFTVFNRIEPYVLGMPFNMFWTGLSLVIVLVNTVLLYRWEHGPVTKP